MEKVITQTKQVTDKTHYFYCDHCGLELGCSHEHIDGWYQELGELDLELYVPKGWYTFRKCLCDSCKEKFLVNLYKTLEDIGFEANKA